jgi:hypothetical protein
MLADVPDGSIMQMSLVATSASPLCYGRQTAHADPHLPSSTLRINLTLLRAVQSHQQVIRSVNELDERSALSLASRKSRPRQLVKTQSLCFERARATDRRRDTVSFMRR